MLRLLYILVIPAGLLVLAALLSPALAKPPFANSLVLQHAPLLIGGIALLLCLRFNRSRLFFALLTLLLVYGVIHWYLPGNSTPLARSVFLATSLLLPVNLLVFSLICERGMLTLAGLSRFALLVVECAVVAGLYYFYPAQLPGWLSITLVDPAVSNWTPLTQPALLTAGVVLLVMNGRLFREPVMANAVMFGLLIAGMVMLHGYRDSQLVTAFTLAGSLMVMLAVIQASYSMAYIDQLTALPGRRALNEQLLKLGNNYALAMVDIDRFKKFNDRYGHDTGDQVLRMVAARLAETAAGGKAFRYGGEEFCIVFPGQDSKTVMAALEATRERVASSRFDLREQNRRNSDKPRRKKKSSTVRVTISIGMAQRTDKLASAHAVIKAADKALYRAKQQGRNRVCK